MLQLIFGSSRSKAQRVCASGPMSTSRTSQLQALLCQSRSSDAISQPSVYALSSIFEPPSHFPATLVRNNILGNSVSDVLEAKLAELGPASRKQRYLRDLGYLGYTGDNVVFLSKKDDPSLQPVEIRVDSDIHHFETIRYAAALSEKIKKSERFLALVTEKEMYCYAARRIDHEEFDFEPGFTVEAPSRGRLTCLCSTDAKRVFCGTNTGDVYELRPDSRDTHPVWVTVGDGELSSSRVRALRIDEAKCLIYALHEDSSVDVFMYRPGHPTETSRRVAGFRSDANRPINFADIFPMPSGDGDTAYLLAVSNEGLLLNFELDLRQPRQAFKFVKKLLRTAPSPSQSLRLTHESSCISARLETENEEKKRVLAAGYFGGLVLAVASGEIPDGMIEFYSVSRLPAPDGSSSEDATRVAFMREPLKLEGQSVDVYAAADDDNTRLFEGVDLGRDELSRQVFLKSTKFVLQTESRILDFRKRCPVELLAEILQVHDPERLDAFFQLYGPIETATMAVQLAASRGDEQARRLLVDDHRLSAALFESEPHRSGELSIPIRSILAYLRRLMAPLWNRCLFHPQSSTSRKDSTKMKSLWSGELLEWFASSLEDIGKFIDAYMEEFRVVRFHDGTIYAPKCPSLLAEFELLFALKDRLKQCTEIMHLIRIFEEAKPVDLAERQLKVFLRKPFHHFVFVDASETLNGLMASILSGKNPEVQEAFTYRMDNELPHLSGTLEKVYNKALALLKKARNSPRLERQEALVHKAMSLLGDSCLERHMDPIIAALSELQRHYEVLQFVSKTTKRLVPDPATSDPEVQKKAHFLRRRCYDRAFAYVSDFIENIDVEDDSSLDIPILYGAVHCLDDRHLMQMMMEKLLSANKVPRRALHQPSYGEFGAALRNYIAHKVMNVSALHEVKEYKGVPLSEVAELEVRLLVDICQSQEEMRAAGDWLMLLAKRESEDGQAIPLIERIGDLNDAKAMYRTVMPEAFMQKIEKEIELAMFQQRVVTMGTRIFAIIEDVMEDVDEVRDVTQRLVDGSTLYRVIMSNFPDKMADDLTIELQKLMGEGYTDIMSSGKATVES